jgi:hypothetical protein
MTAGQVFISIALLYARKDADMASQSVEVGNSNWTFSPYNWLTPGTSEAVTNQPGAYLALSFSGSSQAVLNLETAGIPAGGGVTSMVVQWSIDGVISPARTLTLNDTQLTLATGLDIGAHTVRFWLVSSDYHQDRWTAATALPGGSRVPAQSLRITGLDLDAGAKLLPPEKVAKRIIFFGDSITDGDAMEPAGNAGQTYAVVCAHALGADYGIVGNPGQGWTCNIAPTSGVPHFPDAFSQFYQQGPRLPLPAGTPAPDYVVLNIGTNDAIFGATDDVVTGLVLAWLVQTRGYLPTSHIFVVVPFGGFFASALASATTQYQSTHPSDTAVTCIDLGPTAQKGIMAQIPGGTPQSFDGIHPNRVTHRVLGFQLAAAIKVALGQNDLNSDGRSDLILQHKTSGKVAGWFLDGAKVLNGAFVSPVPDSGYEVVGMADFNGDGKPDLVFQNRVTGQVALWYMNGTAFVSGELVAQTPDSGYKVVSIGDFNGDGRPDLVFQNLTTGQIAFWFMDGARMIGGKLLDQIPDAGYRVVGTGDLNRDGQIDLLFQDDASGALVVWYMNGTSYAGGSVVAAVPQAGYRVEAVGDFNHDGLPDVVMREPNGSVAVWHLDDNGLVFLTQPLSIPLDPAFRIAGPR